MGTYQSTQGHPSFHRPGSTGKWSWCSSKDPFSKTEELEWTPYSEADNKIIEEAYLARHEQATINNYIVEFKLMVQVYSKDKYRQRPVLRKEVEQANDELRPDRFFTETPKPKVFNNEEQHSQPLLVRKWMAKNKRALGHFKIDEYGNVISDPDEVVKKVVDLCVKGIMEEGILLGKEAEASEIVKELETRMNDNIEDILKFCVYLYTLDTFLYRQVNSAIREENIKKMDTLGSFCYLLNVFLHEGCKNLEDSVYAYKGVVYRGTTLSKESIEEYESFSDSKVITWDDLVSTSKNKEKAEKSGNVLFVIDLGNGIVPGYGTDISKLSCLEAREEEVMLPTGGLYYVQKVEHQEKKSIIYLLKKEVVDTYGSKLLYTPSKTVNKDNNEEKAVTPKNLKVHKDWTKEIKQFNTLELYHKSGFANKVIGPALVSSAPYDFASLPTNPKNIYSDEVVYIEDDVVYAGEWNTDTQQPEGRGIIFWSNGRIYEGTIHNFEPTGMGRTFSENGSIYEGEFHQSRPNGKGKFIWGYKTERFGDIYRGEITNSSAHGFGILKYKNGDVYEGQWVDGERHGEGEMRYADGRTYKGDWSHFKRHGSGSLTWVSNKNYTGEFKDDFISGKGVMTYPDGKKEEGIFEKGILVKPL